MITIDKLGEHDNWTCALCGKPVRREPGTRPDSPTRDHIKPRSQGGSNASSNLQLAHRLCNEIRGHQAKGRVESWLTSPDALERIRRHFRSSAPWKQKRIQAIYSEVMAA